MDLGTIAFIILMGLLGLVLIAAVPFLGICFIGYLYENDYKQPIKKSGSWSATIAVIGLSIAVAVGRFTIETRHNLPTWPMSYEALAHLWVGGLIGAGLATKSWLYWWPLILLTVLEVVAFKFL